MILRTPDGVPLDVHVRGGGTGTRLLFLHGVLSSRRTYDWLPPDITDNHEVVTYDYRGHGGSGHQSGTYDFTHYYDDTVQVIEHVGAPVVVVGFSLGGVLGWTLAQRRPDLVRGAFLEDPPIFHEEIYAAGALARFLYFTVEQAKDWVARGLSVDDAARELAQNPVGDGRTWGELHLPESVRQLTEATFARDRGTVVGAAEGSMVDGVDPRPPVRVPVSIIGGDPAVGAVFGPGHAEQLRELHPEIETHNVAGSPHAVHSAFVGRGAYIERLRSFLARYAGPGDEPAAA